MANRARRGRGRGAEPERNLPIVQEPAQPAAAHNFVQPVIPPRHKDPPVFRGAADEDVVNWIFRFEQIADYNQWNPDQRLRHIGMCFEGVAEKWHCSLMTRVPPPLTFDAFREELLRAFKPVNYEDHLETRLRSRVQGSGESFVDYFHDVLFMCSRIDPTMSERSKIGHLFRGLLPGTVGAFTVSYSRIARPTICSGKLKFSCKVRILRQKEKSPRNPCHQFNPSFT